MRPTRLLASLAVLVAGLAGCDLLNGGCPDFGFSEERYPSQTLRTGVPASDTLTVAFVTDYAARVFVRPGVGERVYTSLDPDVALFYEALVGDARPAEPTFETAVRGDTLWVRPGSGLVRLACSPPDSRLDVYVHDVSAPAGVRHVRFALFDDPSVWPEAVLARPSARPRPLLSA